MDEDVLQSVSGMAISELQLQPAVVNGFQRRQVKGESFPVLMPSEQGKVSGVLIRGLTSLALQRIQFFEGEEYQLQSISAEGMPDSHSRILKEGICSANYFADAQVYEIEDTDWSVQTWREHDKPNFMPQLMHYMTFFGALDASEANVHWQLPKE